MTSAYWWRAPIPDSRHILCRVDAQTPVESDDEVFFKVFSTPECHTLRSHTAYGS